MKRRERLAFEHRLLLLAVLGALPALLLATTSVFFLPLSGWARLFLLTVCVACLGAALYAIQQQFGVQLRQLVNLVEAVRSGDFSLRARRVRKDSVIGELFGEINVLADTLQRQRLGAEEAQRLLARVMAEIEVAIFAFDRQDTLRLVNPAGLRLLDRSEEQCLGRSAAQLGLETLLRGPARQLLEHSFPGCSGTWQLRHEGYRERGEQQSLLFVTDLQGVLRAEELKAWKQLIRVVSHEVNNSLTPIASMSASLEGILHAQPLDSEIREDVIGSLQLIQERARRLTEFIRRYAELARLPPPNKRLFDLPALLARLPALLPPRALSLQLQTTEREAWGDPAQLEQLLINLLKNAVEAQQATDRAVSLHVDHDAQGWRVQVRDHGPGIANPANLFVPFYSTKPGGAGIGLVLSRQIAEAHQGRLTLENAEDGGCIAELRLPDAMR